MHTADTSVTVSLIMKHDQHHRSLPLHGHHHCSCECWNVFGTVMTLTLKFDDPSASSRASGRMVTANDDSPISHAVESDGSPI